MFLKFVEKKYNEINSLNKFVEIICLPKSIGINILNYELKYIGLFK